jgi:hypothetical protein
VTAGSWLARVWTDPATGRWCKARIWKDPQTGRWCYDVRSDGVRATGDRPSWAAALREVTDEFTWIRTHEHAWPA